VCFAAMYILLTKLTQPRREKQWQKLSKGWVKVNIDVVFDEATSTGNSGPGCD